MQPAGRVLAPEVESMTGRIRVCMTSPAQPALTWQDERDSELRERVDPPGSLETSGPFPGLHELILVKRSPFGNETGGTRGKPTGDQR